LGDACSIKRSEMADRDKRNRSDLSINVNVARISRSSSLVFTKEEVVTSPLKPMSSLSLHILRGGSSSASTGPSPETYSHFNFTQQPLQVSPFAQIAAQRLGGGSLSSETDVDNNHTHTDDGQDAHDSKQHSSFTKTRSATSTADADAALWHGFVFLGRNRALIPVHVELRARVRVGDVIQAVLQRCFPAELHGMEEKCRISVCDKNGEEEDGCPPVEHGQLVTSIGSNFYSITCDAPHSPSSASPSSASNNYSSSYNPMAATMSPVDRNTAWFNRAASIDDTLLQDGLVFDAELYPVPLEESEHARTEEAEVKQGLAEAIGSGDLARMEQLLERHGEVDVETVDECGRTPLLVAAETNSLAAVVALIKAGCDLNAVIAPPAATPATSDAPTLSLASQGDSALHVACQMGHVEVAETLVLADADLDLLNGRGLSAMQVVGELEEPEVKKILLDLLLL
jgi:hypothetical protein